jgi:hypothetical protein
MTKKRNNRNSNKGNNMSKSNLKESKRHSKMVNKRSSPRPDPWKQCYVGIKQCDEYASEITSMFSGLSTIRDEIAPALEAARRVAKSDKIEVNSKSDRGRSARGQSVPSDLRINAFRVRERLSAPIGDLKTLFYEVLEVYNVCVTARSWAERLSLDQIVKFPELAKDEERPELRLVGGDDELEWVK